MCEYKIHPTKPELRAAIKAHCRGCIYDPSQPGTELQQIERCTVTKCELYNLRPLTGATMAELKAAHYESLTDAEKAAIEAKREQGRKIHASI